MNDFYTEKYLQQTIKIIEDYLDDLSNWSVYNDDKYQGIILEIKNSIEKIKMTSKLNNP